MFTKESLKSGMAFAKDYLEELCPRYLVSNRMGRAALKCFYGALEHDMNNYPETVYNFYGLGKLSPRTKYLSEDLVLRLGRSGAWNEKVNDVDLVRRTIMIQARQINIFQGRYKKYLIYDSSIGRHTKYYTKGKDFRELEIEQNKWANEGKK